MKNISKLLFLILSIFGAKNTIFAMEAPGPQILEPGKKHARNASPLFEFWYKSDIRDAQPIYIKFGTFAEGLTPDWISLDPGQTLYSDQTVDQFVYTQSPNSNQLQDYHFYLANTQEKPNSTVYVRYAPEDREDFRLQRGTAGKFGKFIGVGISHSGLSLKNQIEDSALVPIPYLNADIDDNLASSIRKALVEIYQKTSQGHSFQGSTIGSSNPFKNLLSIKMPQTTLQKAYEMTLADLKKAQNNKKYKNIDLYINYLQSEQFKHLLNASLKAARIDKSYKGDSSYLDMLPPLMREQIDEYLKIPEERYNEILESHTFVNPTEISLENKENLMLLANEIQTILPQISENILHQIIDRVENETKKNILLVSLLLSPDNKYLIINLRDQLEATYRYDYHGNKMTTVFNLNNNETYTLNPAAINVKRLVVYLKPEENFIQFSSDNRYLKYTTASGSREYFSIRSIIFDLENQKIVASIELKKDVQKDM